MKNENAENPLVKASSVIEAPKWRHVPDILEISALNHNCKLDMHVQKRLLRETIFFTFEGKEIDIESLISDLNFILETNIKILKKY